MRRPAPATPSWAASCTPAAISRALSEHLQAGLEASAPDERAVSVVWLAGLRNHQGRPDEALDLLGPALRPGVVMSQPFALVHGRFNQGYALAVSGRPADALRAFAEAGVAVTTTGQTARYAAAVSNYRSWVLRYLGSPDEADEGNLAAVEGTTFVEAQAQAMVDLVDGCLHRGDLDGAAAVVGRGRAAAGRRPRHALAPRARGPGCSKPGWPWPSETTTPRQARAAEVVGDAERMGLPRYRGAGRAHPAVGGDRLRRRGGR